MNHVTRLARKYAPRLGSIKVSNAGVAALAIGVTAAVALAQAAPPDIGAIEPPVTIESIGTSITGGLQTLFEVIVPIALSVALVLGVVTMGLKLLRGRRPG